jgi:large subunit ribosomal protein L11
MEHVMGKSKKRIRAIVKIQLKAGEATPAPPVGTALGPHGINIMDFVKTYNERTQSMKGQVIPAVIEIYEDRSISFELKKPPVVDLIKQAIGIQSGSAMPNRDKVGKLKQSQMRQIAETKMSDLNANDVEAAMKMVAGTARSMGVDVLE